MKQANPYSDQLHRDLYARLREEREAGVGVGGAVGRWWWWGGGDKQKEGERGTEKEKETRRETWEWREEGGGKQSEKNELQIK